jgi:hypothetical protein
MWPVAAGRTLFHVLAGAAARFPYIGYKWTRLFRGHRRLSSPMAVYFNVALQPAWSHWQVSSVMSPASLQLPEQ